MTQAYTGMRKGISLVEMMIAIILFAALATVGLKYTKNYINTDLQAMKARVAAAMDQGSQLTQAYKLYTTQYGTPTSINDFNATETKVMTDLPAIITEMSTLGWDLNTSTGVGSGYAFTMKLDGNTTALQPAQYCQIWNKEFNSSVELNVSGTEDAGTIDAPNYAPATGLSYCFGTHTDGYTVIVKLP
ncbi:MAG: prepilin-type N-terminal cleavage/methylation domain-containing protein [Sulfuricurvum sp.]|nr:prepilin-type N-terminal cleavage/methylation domain-containing protein [Sulfuricurvum sp.]